MAAIVECNHCGKTGRYDKFDIHNIGTKFVPLFVVKCYFCGNQITMGETKDSLNDDPLSFPTTTKEQMINELTILINRKKLPELLLQKYFTNEYKFYCYDGIKGPFPKGPDFIVIKDGAEIQLELETDIFNYIIHKHHESDSFKNAEILAYLTYNERIEYYKNVPKTFLQFDKDHFFLWCWKQYEDRFLVANLVQRIEFIYDEYIRIFAQVLCDRKDSDMAICPNCSDCAYFGEEFVISSTNKYLKTYPEILTNNKFDFKSVTRDSLIEEL